MDKINKINLSEQTKFRLDEISKIENYFINEISQRKSCSHIDKIYIDKILVILSATTGGVSLFSFASIVRAPVGIISTSFTLIFSLTTRIVTKILDTLRKKIKKHDKILMLVKSKLSSIDILIAQALIDMNISHEEYIMSLKEKDRYEMMEENLKNKNGEPYEIIRFNSVKSKNSNY